MKNRYSILFAVMAFGVGLLSVQMIRAVPRKVLPGKSAPSPVLRIQIPKDINTDNLTIVFGVYGQGLGVQKIDTKSGVHDYTVNLGSRAESIKMLVYAPGYKVVTAEFNAKSVSFSRPFVPRFDKLPTTPLKLKVVDSNGNPVAHETISLSHSLASHQYFGYLDGMVFEAALLTATSDSKGEINVELPLLLEDPYFGKHRLSNLNLSNGEKTFKARGEQNFRPAQLPVHKRYEQAVTVTRIYRATLSGRINPSFFQRHKIKGEITPYMDAKRYSPFRVEMRAETSDGRSSRNCKLLNDGTFSVVLPSGAYDLHLMMLGRGENLRRKITIRNIVVLRENENRQLVVK